MHYDLEYREADMPTIVRLTDSVKISMYAGDHNPPHFPVLTGDGKAFMVSIDTLQVIKGTVNAKAFAMAVAWAVNNREMLITRWGNLNG